MQRKGLAAPLYWPVQAVKSHFLGNEQPGAAVRNFSKLKGVGRPPNPHRFIKFWANRFVTTRSVQKALIPGRNRKFPHEVARGCAQVAIRRCGTGGWGGEALLAPGCSQAQHPNLL